LLTRRKLLRWGVMAPVLPAMIRRGEASSVSWEPQCSSRARRLVESTLVVDMLAPLTLDWPKAERWLADPGLFGEQDWLTLRRSGVRLYHLSVSLQEPDPHLATRVWLKDWERFFAAHPAKFLMVRHAGDLKTLVRSPDRVGVLMGMQDSTHFRSPSDVALFAYTSSQRISQLTYNPPNSMGCGCAAPEDTGVTSLGQDVLSAMQECRMIVDVSHCGPRTTLETIEASSRPVLVTHSNAQALVPQQARCKSDEAIRRLAKAGGVFGVTGIRCFVSPKPAAATLERMLDHVDHVVRIAGVEAVGIGSDVDGSPSQTNAVAHMASPGRIYSFTDALIRRRYSDAQIRLILGGNFRRVLAQLLPPAPQA
jgi:membrane dipeptidase